MVTIPKIRIFYKQALKINKTLLHQLSCQKQQFTALDSKTALLQRAKILHHPEERHRPTRAGTSPQNRNAKFLFENLNVQEALPQRPPKPRRENVHSFCLDTYYIVNLEMLDYLDLRIEDFLDPTTCIQRTRVRFCFKMEIKKAHCRGTS